MYGFDMEKIIKYGERQKELGYDEGRNHIVYPDQITEIKDLLLEIEQDIDEFASMDK